MARRHTQIIPETDCIGDSLDLRINPNFLNLDEAVQGLSSAIDAFTAIDTPTVDLTYSSNSRSLNASVRDNSIDYTKVASGMVLNCVNVFTNSVASYAVPANTDTEIVALSITITPKLITSRILIQAMINAEHHHDSVYRLKRVVGASVTDLGTAVADGVRLTGIAPMPYDADNSTTMTNTYIQFYDSPNTAEPVSYKFYVRRADVSTFFLNRTITDGNFTYSERASSSVTLLEIKG
jgi:hypothetical protein